MANSPRLIVRNRARSGSAQGRRARIRLFRYRVGLQISWTSSPNGVDVLVAARASRYRSLEAWLTWARRCTSATPRRSGRHLGLPFDWPCFLRRTLKSLGLFMVVSTRQYVAAFVVRFDRVLFHAVLDANALGAIFEVAGHFSFVV